MPHHLPHALKCRPNTFSEVIWQSHVVDSLANAIRMKQVPQCILLTGTRGVGKTTIGRIFAKCLNCLSNDEPTAEPCLTCEHCEEMQAGRFPDFYEIDAASHTKVDQVRELQDTIPYVPTKGRYKVYLIDEVHMLSKSSFNALLKTLEEPPEHVIFILATTDPQKLPATILSRCLQFHLQAMPKEAIADHLKTVLSKEAISFDQTALSHIARAARGSMRDAFSLLDQCLALGNGSITDSAVSTMLGTIDQEPLFRTLQALANQDATALFNELTTLRRSGACLATALNEIAELLQRIARIQLVGPIDQEGDSSTLTELANALDKELVQLLYQIAIHGQRDLAHSPSVDCGVEMTLLRMLAFTNQSPEPTPVRRQQHTRPTPVSTSQPLQTAAPKESKTPSETNLQSFWLDLVPRLQLRGLALVLAKSCTLTKKTDSEWHLSLSSSQKPMLQPRTEKALNDALIAHHGSPVQIIITFNDSSDPKPEAEKSTPATSDKNTHKKQLDNPKSSPAPAQSTQSSDNPNVNKLIDAFSATIVDSTVVR